MARNAVHLVVAILAFSVIIFLNDLPTTFAARVLHESQAIPSPKDTFQMNGAENVWETMEMVEGGRMDMEINRDYPGSGANNRHTPYPPVKD